MGQKRSETIGAYHLAKVADDYCSKKVACNKINTNVLVGLESIELRT